MSSFWVFFWFLSSCFLNYYFSINQMLFFVHFRCLGTHLPAAWWRNSPTCCSSPPRCPDSWWLRSDEEPPINPQVSLQMHTDSKNALWSRPTCRVLWHQPIISHNRFVSSVFLLAVQMNTVVLKEIFVLYLDTKTVLMQSFNYRTNCKAQMEHLSFVRYT